MFSQAGTARGAYGLAISGLEDAAGHLREAPEDWPPFHVEQVRGTAADPQPPGTVVVEDDRGEVWLGGGDRIDVDRAAMTMRLTTRAPVGADAILHPFLGLPASMVNRWLGRRSLHGGAFLAHGRAWSLLGQREAGKSATLGCLLRRGTHILSDDILVFDGATLMGGPRSVDLRAGPAAQLGGDDIGIVGNRPRWRLRPDDGPASAPAGGFVHLEWGDATRMEPISPEDRLRGLVGSSVFGPGPDDALPLLELAALPAWRFVRERDIGSLEAATDHLLATLASHAA